MYSSSPKDCKNCLLKNHCIPAAARSKKLHRWTHQAMLDAHHIKMKTDESRAIIKRRGAIVEHPFGTIKRMLGWDHYWVRGINKVSGENALIMFSYNFKRVLNILGVAGFIDLMLAIKAANIRHFLFIFTQYYYFYGLLIIILFNSGDLIDDSAKKRILKKNTSFSNGSRAAGDAGFFTVSGAWERG